MAPYAVGRTSFAPIERYALQRHPSPKVPFPMELTQDPDRVRPQLLATSNAKYNPYVLLRTFCSGGAIIAENLRSPNFGGLNSDLAKGRLLFDTTAYEIAIYTHLSNLNHQVPDSNLHRTPNWHFVSDVHSFKTGALQPAPEAYNMRIHHGVSSLTLGSDFS